jgi:hypothetical protein
MHPTLAESHAPSMLCGYSMRATGFWRPEGQFVIRKLSSKWSMRYQLEFQVTHQKQKIPSGRMGSVKVDSLQQSSQRHPGCGLLCARHQLNASRFILPSDRCFTGSSRSVGLLFQTITLAVWPTVTICENEFIGYALASGLQCNG